MKIRCNNCNKLLFEITKGTRIKEPIYCKKCFDANKVSYDPFDNIFGGFNK